MVTGDITLVQSKLSPDLMADFDRVASHHGIAARADVIRFLIRQEARRVSDGTKTDRVISGWVMGHLTADEAMEALTALTTRGVG